MGFWKERVYLCVDSVFGIFRRLVFSSVVLRYGCVHRDELGLSTRPGRLHTFGELLVYSVVRRTRFGSVTLCVSRINILPGPI